jgi:hypothetical protein
MSWQHYESQSGVFPIQIREDLVVRIYPIPHDLTEAEAEKIARIVRALAAPEPRSEHSIHDSLELER